MVRVNGGIDKCLFVLDRRVNKKRICYQQSMTQAPELKLGSHLQRLANGRQYNILLLTLTGHAPSMKMCRWQ